MREVYQSLKMGRRGIGVELKDSYFQQSVLNCKNIVKELEEKERNQEITMDDYISR